MTELGKKRDSMEEHSLLAGLKDRFIRFYPNITLNLVDLEKKFLDRESKILVVGSGRIAKVKGPKVVNVDIRPFESVAVVCDAQALPFRDGEFDAVVCHQVLEHVPDADRAVVEMHRVLKPGGRVIVTVPFYFPFHASPHDYRRWTVPGMRQTFSAFEEVDSDMYIGPVCAVLSGIQHFSAMLMPGFYLTYFAKTVVGWLLYLFKYLDLLIARLPNAIHLAASVYFVGRKPPSAVS